MPLARSLLLVTATAAACGCTGDRRPSEPTRPAEVRDSAGVAWIRNFDPVWTDGTAWRVDPEAVLRIGAADGDAPYLLTDVRGATRLSDGRIAVMDGATFELRAFTADGRHEWTAGGKGGGPGEVSWYPLHVRGLPGDTLQIEDGLRRIRYDANGQLLEHEQVDWSRAVRFATYTSECLPVPRFVGELVLLAVRPCGMAVDERIQQSHLRRSTARLDVLPWSLASADTLGTFLDDEWWVHAHQGSGIVVRPLIQVGGRFAVTDAPPRLAYAATDRYRIFIYDLAPPALVRVIDRPEETAAPTADRITRAAEEWEARVRRNPVFEYVPQELNRVLAERQQIPLPEVTASLDELMFDALGYLWVGHYVEAGSVARTWAVYRPDGVFLGELALPADLTVREIGRDYILGTSRDAYDVPYVSMLALERGPRN